MADWFVAFMFGAGAAGWSYAKLARRTGYGNAANAVIGAAVIFVVGFMFFFSLLRWVLHIG